MNDNELGLVHRLLLHLPVLTTLFAIYFATELFSRYRRKGGGPHLLWWGIGMVTYGIGTFTEAYTTIMGWDPFIFRCWYVAGAFLGGYPLAQGSIYLLMRRRFANLSAWIVTSAIAVASIFVFLSPLDVSLAETHRLSGQVLEWSWVRLISPFFNLYAVIFLVGGAIVSALRFRRSEKGRDRYIGNIWIAIGAILPGIGGSMTRAGVVEALYVTELIGLLLIFTGYRLCVRDRPLRGTVRKPVAATAALLLAFTTAGLAGSPAYAMNESDPEAAADSDEGDSDELPSFYARTTVTATGRENDSFEIPTPVTVIQRSEIEESTAQNAADLLATQPGVDVNGVGPNQSRPVIRGQRGLRVLFLEDGLRMNNARRQTDFGEIPGLIDLALVETVEVVRGPASVLYGSDAIGGVLNLLTKSPATSGLRGQVGVEASSADERRRLYASADGRSGKLSYGLGLTRRETEDYEAPSGTYGEITLSGDTRVFDTGLSDNSYFGTVGYEINDRHQLSLRYNRYRAEETGFGFVEPADIGNPDPFRIRILYPFQDFDRAVAKYLGSPQGVLADGVEVQAYRQSNERQLVNDIDNIIIGPIFPGAPDSFVEADTSNFTDLDTTGLRAELFKELGKSHLLTYGFEAWEDKSVNTDFSTTTTVLRFPFPPFEVRNVSTDSLANAPNATNTSYGFFLQNEIMVGERLEVIVGGRYQSIETNADPTPGWDVSGLDFSDDSVVGALNLLFRVNDNLNLVGSFGTAFRAPNIIERLFNGPTPEGAGFQLLNPDLTAEESENIDLGLKYRRRNAYMELVWFRNDIDKGIIQYFYSPSEVAALPAAVQQEILESGARFVVQQRNIDQLRYEGIEMALGYRSERGWEVGANYTHLDAERVDSTQPPTGDTFSDKVNLFARYRPTSGRYWVEYRVRHNGSTDASLDPNEPVPPVGETLPSFTVHSVGGGVKLFERGRQSHHLQVTVENLTDELYAEFSNATFFRPQPGRNVIGSYRVKF